MVIVGGGFAGAVAAIHILRSQPTVSVCVVERRRRLGRGLAFGDCDAGELLNVPVCRMGIGVEPNFEQWILSRWDRLGPVLTSALAETGGDLATAFVPRWLFGEFVEWHFEAARRRYGPWRLSIICDDAVGFLHRPQRGVALSDGRRLECDLVLLATGNMPPKTPAPEGSPLHGAKGFIPDPWAPGALQDIEPAAPVILIGTGLTMVDIAFRLSDRGHAAPMIAVSRHGLLPKAHALDHDDFGSNRSKIINVIDSKGLERDAGGKSLRTFPHPAPGGPWPSFIEPLSPRRLLRAVRREVRAAQAQGAPWQNVIDAIRPSAVSIWRSWSPAQRRQFLRHVRPRWDVVRHRLAPRAHARLEGLLRTGALQVRAGRIQGFDVGPDHITVQTTTPAGPVSLTGAVLINCTGPRSDFGVFETPLFADARRQGLIRPDALGLGVETIDCAVVDQTGRASTWLFALGSLTRPDRWEITAAPEIVRQIMGFAAPSDRQTPRVSPMVHQFAEIGANI